MVAMTLADKFWNWWRGWDDRDYQSAQIKLSGNTVPGAVTWVTNREMRAITANRNNCSTAYDDDDTARRCLRLAIFRMPI